jgi:hypothetical protein
VKVETLWNLPKAELARVVAQGHPIPREQLRGAYRGVSLGLPTWVDRVAWKVFRKVFEPDGRGYNVRVRQPAAMVPVAEAEPLVADRTFGPFAVTELPDETPFGCRAGLLLDYGATHPVWHPMAAGRDVVVAVNEGSAELLLGAMYLQVGLRARTPSFFTLEREPAREPGERR